MKHIALVLTLLALTLPVAAQKEKSILKQADLMIAQRQYESAYRLLDSFDPTNDRAAVLLKKEEIVLSYFAQSIMHRMFSLKDLAEGESLDSVRINFKQGNVFAFDADSLTRRLLAKHPHDKALLAGHTRYHDALLNNYDDNVWSMFLDSACLALLAADKENPSACYQLGFYHLLNEDYAAAEPLLLKTVKLCDTVYQAHYNLGVVEYYLNKYPQAVTHLRRAYHGYRHPALKGDAARIIGILYDHPLDKADSALHYYQLAVAIDSAYLNQAFLLGYYLRHSHPKADELALRCWRAALVGDDTFGDLNDLVGRYMELGMSKAAAQFLMQRYADALGDYERGLCCIYLGRILSDTPADAIPWLEAGIKHFEKEEAPEEFLDSLRQMIDRLR